MKLQQFYVLKLESGRLKESNYKIKLTLDEARKNGEVVSIGYNQVIKTVLRLAGRRVDIFELENLLAKKKKLVGGGNSRVLLRTLNEIDKILYVPEIINVHINHKSHYKIMATRGFYVNGVKYVRLLAGSGNIRRDAAFFCSDAIYDDLLRILKNGHSDIEIVPAKYNAYFALLNSAALPVSFPNFTVVSDCLIKKSCDVDFIGDDDVVVQRNLEVECNAFDGQGLISPKLCSEWASDLGLEYIPSSFIIRAPFIKGMVCAFDFHRFAKDVAGKKIIVDIYGNLCDIDDIDLILTESQFKMWQGYPSIENYVSKCNDNGLGFAVSRAAPQEDKSYVRSNYQFLQVLDIDDDGIRELCQPTINYFNDLQGAEPMIMALHSIGQGLPKGNLFQWFDGLNDIAKAILIEPRIANDEYIMSRYLMDMKSRMEESFLGALYFNGNYSILISDPYAQAQHIFGMGVTGLLPEGEYFSPYWNGRDVDRVVGCRAPLTYQSEHVVLNLQNRADLNDWYEHIKTGIISPAYGIGIDYMRWADADNDGDLLATYNDPTFLAGVQGGLPITYEKQSAEKTFIKYEDLWVSDRDGFGTKIGYITNVASTLYAMLSDYGPGSKEYETILSRLKKSRKLQGNTIDAGKGIISKPFPEHWVKYRRIPDDAEDDEKEEIRFENSILADRRPLFFRWLYKHYQKRYRKEILTYDHYSSIKFGKTFQELRNTKNRTQDQDSLVNNYYKFSFFLHNNCIMNRISDYMQEEVSKLRCRVDRVDFDWHILLGDYEVSDEQLAAMNDIYVKFIAFKREGRDSSGVRQFSMALRRAAIDRLGVDIAQLAHLAVLICYENDMNRSFVWGLFSDGIVEILSRKNKTVSIPVPDSGGDFTYLWEKFSIIDMEIQPC